MLPDFYSREYFIQNPEIFAVVLGILVFAIIFSFFQRKFISIPKGASILISFVISLVTTWQLYRREFYGYEASLVVLLYFLVIVIFLKLLIWPFFRRIKMTLGKSD